MRLRLGIITVLIVALVAVPTAAFAATFQGSGTSASAWGEVWDDGAELPRMTVGIYGGESRFTAHTQMGKPDRMTDEGVSIYLDYPVFDQDGAPADGYTTVMFSLVPYDLGIDRYLTRAGVQATVEGVREVYDFQPCPDQPDCWEGVVVSSEPVTAEVDITWSGIGPLQRYRSLYRELTPTFRFADHTQGRTREAAVIGSIVIDGVDVIEGVDLYGSLDDSRYHSVQFGTLPY